MYKPKSRVHTEQNPKIPLIYNNIYGVILSEVEGSRQELRLDTLKTQSQDYNLLTILNSQPPHCVIPHCGNDTGSWLQGITLKFGEGEESRLEPRFFTAFRMTSRYFKNKLTMNINQNYYLLNSLLILKTLLPKNGHFLPAYKLNSSSDWNPGKKRWVTFDYTF